jgi:hypothetical protein
MASNRPQHKILLFGSESTQLVSQRRTNHSPAKLVLHAVRELLAKREPSFDPLALVPEQSPNRARTELLLVAE